MPRSSRVLLIGWCLLSVWLFYAGLELDEALKVFQNTQSCEQDLDLEALLQIGSGLKPDLLAWNTPGVLFTTFSASE